MLKNDPEEFFNLSLSEQKRVIRFLVPSFDAMDYSKKELVLCRLLKQFDLAKYREKLAERLLEITRLCDVIPARHNAYRQIVHDGVVFLISRISEERFNKMLAEQFILSDETTSEQRLLELVKHMPTLHKLGQVIARNQNVDASFRKWLVQLENGIHSVTYEAIKGSIEKELAHFPQHNSVFISPVILAEASVAAVVPFIWDNELGQRVKGVFKVLKPRICEYLDEELSIVDELAGFYDRHRQNYELKDFPFLSTLEDIKTLLLREIEPTCEQENLKLAYAFFGSNPFIKIPRVFAMSTKTMTAMEKVRGWKVTEAPLSDKESRKCCKQIFRALIASPLFSYEPESRFHGDPHGGNIFITRRKDINEIQVALLDWSLAGTLSKIQRYHVIRMCFSILANDSEMVYQEVEALAESELTSEKTLSDKVKVLINQELKRDGADMHQWVRRTFNLIDNIAAKGVRFPSNLLLFRKAVFTLEGVLKELDPDFDMDDSMKEFLTEVLVEEFPCRYWSLWFPLRESPGQYRTLLSNSDIAFMLGRTVLNNYFSVLNKLVYGS